MNIELGDKVKTLHKGLESLTFTVKSYSKKFKWFYCECEKTKVKYSITESELIKL